MIGLLLRSCFVDRGARGVMWLKWWVHTVGLVGAAVWVVFVLWLPVPMALRYTAGAAVVMYFSLLLAAYVSRRRWSAWMKRMEPVVAGCRRVLLVHGIRTDAYWQTETAELLVPFFKPVLIRYSEYRYLGALALACEPMVLAVGLAVSIALLVAIEDASRYPLVAVLLLLTAYVGFRLRLVRLGRALRVFARRFDDEARSAGSPHVIAHSLGTYLTVHALAVFPGVRLDRLILCGCVLPREYGWTGLYQAQLPRVRGVRNETGLSDWIPKVARKLSRFAPEFGNAGSAGFAGPPTDVHNLAAGSPICNDGGVGCHAFLHNVPLEFGHSTYFQGGGHFEWSWLPYLLKHDAFEWAKFHDLCADAAEAKRNSDPSLAAFERAILDHSWQWARNPVNGGGTLRDDIERRLRLLKAPVPAGDEARDEVALWVVGEICDHVSWARLERGRGRKGDQRTVLGLVPTIALHRAVEAVSERLNRYAK